ncbi:MAG: DUF1256 domain-containing protein [Clostridia bacterium]
MVILSDMESVNYLNESNQNKLVSNLKGLVGDRTPVFICIGAQNIPYDCIGAIVGDMLMDAPFFVYSNINAVNLLKAIEFIKTIHYGNDYCFIAIDAAIGAVEEIGCIKIIDGGIFPGSATNKNLTSVGDIGIIAVTNSNSFSDYYSTSSAILCRAKAMSQFIATVIKTAFI